MKGIADANAIPDYNIVMGERPSTGNTTSRRASGGATTVTIQRKPSLADAS